MYLDVVMKPKIKLILTCNHLHHNQFFRKFFSHCVAAEQSEINKQINILKKAIKTITLMYIHLFQYQVFECGCFYLPKC